MRNLLLLGVLAATAGVAAAGKPAAPKKPDVTAALEAKLGKKPQVSKTLGEIAPGRWVALYLVRDRKKETAQHGVATLTVGADGKLAVDGTLALPSAATPTETVEQAKWGTSGLKDYDGDGKLELFVIYGYNGPMEAAVGDIYYRDFALLNLDAAPVMALHVQLDQMPQASVFDEISTKWSFSKPGAPAEVVTTSVIGEYDEAAAERRTRKLKTTYQWDRASDSWKAVKPAK